MTPAKLLAVLAVSAPHPVASRNVVYAHARQDGCGMLGIQATYLLFTAEEFGLEAGGLLLNSTKEHKPHGRASAESTSVAPAGAREISPRAQV